jgi:hypothetical protein
MQAPVFATLDHERAWPSRAKIDAGAWLPGNANFQRFCRARPAVARRWLAWARGGDGITSNWGRAWGTSRQGGRRGGGWRRWLAHATTGFRAVGDLFERGWDWGPGEEEVVVEGGDIIDDSSRGTEAGATRKGEHRVRGREGRNRLARGRRGAPPQAHGACQEATQVIGL